MRLVRTTLVLAALVMGAPLAAAPAKTGPYGLPPLPRDDFNRLAVHSGLPLFWELDANADGLLDPSELVLSGVGGKRERWVKGGAFTKDFEKSYRALVELRRREAIRKELDQGRPTLVKSDLAALPAADKKFVGHVLAAAAKVEALFQKQVGADSFRARVAKLDPESRAVFERNQGPWCEGPETEADPFCNALADFPGPRWDTYPSDETQDVTLCEKLRALPNGKELLAPFTVVRKKGGEYVAVPYQEAYGKEMKAIAKDLLAAADAAHTMEGEAALETYLRAAAKGFEANTWDDADEAWAAMNSQNSKWYLRIAPDEVYWDVCQEKAGFHVSFARIDEGSLVWQQKLTPLRDTMEKTLAELIGAPYAPRSVAFHMPDFIAIVWNAGNSRSAFGATIGQSLPNWGKVAEEGRGRTVVMSSLYTDPDSKELARTKAAVMLTADAMAFYTDDPASSLVDIILHEATHNLGPHSDYKIDGRDPSAIFGGRMASMLEELKAQTGGLFFVDLLKKSGVIDEAFANQIYTHSMVWAFGHIAQGMMAANGVPKPYSQLAAIQVGSFVKAGALTWVVEDDPTTGRPTGRFRIDYAKMPQAIADLAQRAGRIKATGDVKAGEAILAQFVTGEDKGLVHAEEIQERLRKFSKGSLVYAVGLD